MKKFERVDLFIKMLDIIRTLTEREMLEEEVCKDLFCEMLDTICYIWVYSELSSPDRELKMRLFNLVAKTGRKFFDNLESIKRN